MAQKLMVIVTAGPEDPERATIGMGMAFHAIQNPDVEVVVAFQLNGVWLAKQGIVEHFAVENMPPFMQIREGFLNAGGRIIVCEPCAKTRRVTQDMCFPGATIVPSTELVKEVLSSDKTLVY